jgi:hypothetical protein
MQKLMRLPASWKKIEVYKDEKLGTLRMKASSSISYKGGLD